MQNDQTLQQALRQYESEMPPEILDLIKSFDWKKEMRAIVNQNQLMIDVGADIEESVYLMILGVIGGNDLYDRLTNTHEMPEDKARKVMGEIESMIFNPLHQKLMDLDEKRETAASSLEKTPISFGNTPSPVADSPSVPVVSVSPAVAAPMTAPVQGAPVTRDDILAEIEKDAEPIVIKQPTMPSAGGSVDAPKSADQGVAKSFSMSASQAVPVVSPEISPEISAQVSIEPAKPSLGVGEVTSGLQPDPISAGLNQPTVTQATPASSDAPTKSYAVDPYREPIE